MYFSQIIYLLQCRTEKRTILHILEMESWALSVLSSIFIADSWLIDFAQLILYQPYSTRYENIDSGLPKPVHITGRIGRR